MLKACQILDKVEILFTNQIITSVSWMCVSVLLLHPGEPHEEAFVSAQSYLPHLTAFKTLGTQFQLWHKPEN